MRSDKGFTLVELVIVIAVIAVISTILLVTFTGVIDDANDAKSALESNQNEKQDYIHSILDGDTSGTTDTSGDAESDNATAGGTENMATFECPDAASLISALADSTLENTVIKLTGEESYTINSSANLCVNAKNCVLDLNGSKIKFEIPSTGIENDPSIPCMTINESFSITDSNGGGKIECNAGPKNMFLINADFSISDISILYEIESALTVMFALEKGSAVFSNVFIDVYELRTAEYYFLESSAGTNMSFVGGYICLYPSEGFSTVAISVGGDFSISSDCDVDDGESDVLTPYIVK